MLSASQNPLRENTQKNLRQLVDGEELQIPSTIDDASIFDEINQQSAIADLRL